MAETPLLTEELTAVREQLQQVVRGWTPLKVKRFILDYCTIKFLAKNLTYPA